MRTKNERYHLKKGVEMYLDKSKQYKGKKAKVGSTIIIDDGEKETLGVFVGYCPDCRYKVMMNRKDARVFANKFHRQKESLSERRLCRLISHRIQEQKETEKERYKQKLKHELDRLELDTA